MSRYTSDAAQRRSKKYIALHAQLAREVKQPRRSSLATKSPKQIRKFAKSELYYLYGDTP